MLIYVFWYFFEKDTYYLKLYEIIFFWYIKKAPLRIWARSRETEELGICLPRSHVLLVRAKNYIINTWRNCKKYLENWKTGTHSSIDNGDHQDHSMEGRGHPGRRMPFWQ